VSRDRDKKGTQVGPAKTARGDQAPGQADDPVKPTGRREPVHLPPAAQSDPDAANRVDRKPVRYSVNLHQRLALSQRHPAIGVERVHVDAPASAVDVIAATAVRAPPDPVRNVDTPQLLGRPQGHRVEAIKAAGALVRLGLQTCRASPKTPAGIDSPVVHLQVRPVAQLICHRRELALWAKEPETFPHRADEASVPLTRRNCSYGATYFPPLKVTRCEVIGQDQAGENVDPQQPVLTGVPDQAFRVVEDLVHHDRYGWRGVLSHVVRSRV